MATSEAVELRERLAAELAVDGLRLATPRPDIELSPLQEADAETNFRLIEDNREHLRTWLGWLDATRTVEDARGFITASRQATADEGTIVWGIRRRGELVGVISYHAIDWEAQRTSLGYWLAAPAVGQGIVGAAAHAVVDLAFRRLALRSVQARVAPDNLRSRAVVERLGFRAIDRIEHGEVLYGRVVAHDVLAIERARWLAAAGTA